MGGGDERIARLVEPDVAVGTDAEDLEVDAARRRDIRFVARALFVEIGGRAIEEMNPRGRELPG
jgi:hypothetical protein